MNLQKRGLSAYFGLGKQFMRERGRQQLSPWNSRGTHLHVERVNSGAPLLADGKEKTSLVPSWSHENLFHSLLRWLIRRIVKVARGIVWKDKTRPGVWLCIYFQQSKIDYAHVNVCSLLLTARRFSAVHDSKRTPIAGWTLQVQVLLYLPIPERWYEVISWLF